MVKFVGFSEQEEALIAGLMARFRDKDFCIDELTSVEKDEIPGYDGLVVPKRLDDDRLEMTMLLSSCSPFVIAHELAHVSDISVRRQDSMDNMSAEMSTQWHLAYRMSAEYYANRVACDYADADDIFRAFRSDARGLIVAAIKQDWASFLINYALLLGVLHGIGRMDCEPMEVVAHKGSIPLKVLKGMAGFKGHAPGFFETYAAQPAAAAA